MIIRVMIILSLVAMSFLVFSGIPVEDAISIQTATSAAKTVEPPADASHPDNGSVELADCPGQRLPITLHVKITSSCADCEDVEYDIVHGLDSGSRMWTGGVTDTQGYHGISARLFDRGEGWGFIGRNAGPGGEGGNSTSFTWEPFRVRFVGMKIRGGECDGMTYDIELTERHRF